jgi:hypothetical protein
LVELVGEAADAVEARDVDPDGAEARLADVVIERDADAVPVAAGADAEAEGAAAEGLGVTLPVADDPAEPLAELPPAWAPPRYEGAGTAVEGSTRAPVPHGIAAPPG